MQLQKISLASVALGFLTLGASAQVTVQVPGNQPTIQAGIDAAQAGDTVLVAPGTYFERIDFSGKAITVKSSGGPAATIIDGSTSLGFDVVTAASGETVSTIFSGFTVTHGESIGLFPGRAVFLFGASPTITNCVLTQNDASRGGGLYIENSSAQVFATTITQNSATGGGGIYVKNASPTFTNVVIDSNTGTGAILRNSSPVFTGCSISSNLVGAEGGGVFAEDCDLVTFIDCTLNDNDGLFSDAGALLIRNSEVLMTGCTVARNLATFDDHRGGGIYLESGRLQFKHGVLADNESAQGGGLWSAGDLLVTGSRIEGNSSTFTGQGWQGHGGGVYIGGGSAVISRCVFTGNQAASVFGGTTGGQGGAVWGPAQLIHCTLSANTATYTGEGGGVWGASMKNCIHFGNTPAALPASNPLVTYSDVEGGTAGLGNIALDPLLANRSMGNFTLSAGSPCIDAGDPNSEPDPDGSVADMGAFPSGDPTTSYCTAGTSAGGCQALLSASGAASASAATGFLVSTTGMAGSRDGIVYWGTNGRQATAWGNSTSFQCILPPTVRGALIPGSGTTGACDGGFAYDLNARWTAKPNQNPGAGAVLQLQFWYRDPQNTSNQTTSLSDAIEFSVAP